ncbi:hypothetical protein K523DRAFT_359056 [Schizophyllum commune Tattone D]|nr:hypothetical protein K523DRAFT_359056 [Schizophyllum commune Tattone D]
MSSQMLSLALQGVLLMIMVFQITLEIIALRAYRGTAVVGYKGLGPDAFTPRPA